MPPKLPVVINTGPLIALAAALGDLEALAQVAVMVVVPGEVFTECAVGAHHDDTADKVRAAICCHIRPVFSELPPSLWDLLDIGEAAVIRRNHYGCH
jgi:predicted nucleic acid-binding protein